ncbi:MAG: acyltransferase [Bacteroides sp.]|nr:acyltransferase [Bacteroides sp.]MBD5364030.1 acyltransferase [Bacteroides sp.]
MERRIDLDIIKGIAIIAVIFYHIGILPYGYLGVDIFMVISGFLIIPSVIEHIVKDDFSYFAWLWHRLNRFVPLVIIVCIVALIIGYFTMMPDDYENLAASVVASELFCNNILLSITTCDYWNTLNEYRPLMALWYLGIVVQFFVSFPIVLLLVKFLSPVKKRIEDVLINTLGILALVSFSIFLLLPIDYSIKFYYLPFRIWEFCIGGLAFYLCKKGIKISNLCYFSILSLMIVILCMNFTFISEINNETIVGVPIEDDAFISKELILMTMVFLSSMLLLSWPNRYRGSLVISYIGKISLSLYVWHQLILAFTRYCFDDNMTVGLLSVFLLNTLLISVFSYYFFENIRINTIFKKISWGLLWAGVLFFSLFAYNRAGVMRDVPEMGVTLDNPYVVRNTSYIDKIYELDKPFEEDKIKVLVIGNSFARDFACVIQEWDKTNKIEISYIFEPEEDDERYSLADYIFIFGPKYQVPSYIFQKAKDSSKIFGIGTKKFGKSVGKVYNQRHSPNYLALTTPVSDKLNSINKEWHNSWGHNYIDFVNASLNKNGEIQLFTPDGQFISFDCAHLSPAGAKFFANKFDFEQIFNITQ